MNSRSQPIAVLAAALALWAAGEALHAARPLPVGRSPTLPDAFVPDVNVAPLRHLLLLPRVGPVRAGAIVDSRAREGPFPDLGALERVYGVGPVTVAGLRGLARAAADGPAVGRRTTRGPIGPVDAGQPTPGPAQGRGDLRADPAPSGSATPATGAGRVTACASAPRPPA